MQVLEAIEVRRVGQRLVCKDNTALLLAHKMVSREEGVLCATSARLTQELIPSVIVSANPRLFDIRAIEEGTGEVLDIRPIRTTSGKYIFLAKSA